MQSSRLCPSFAGSEMIIGWQNRAAHDRHGRRQHDGGLQVCALYQNTLYENAQKRTAPRLLAGAFPCAGKAQSLSLRTSAHTGVAIRILISSKSRAEPREQRGTRSGGFSAHRARPGLCAFLQGLTTSFLGLIRPPPHRRDRCIPGSSGRQPSYRARRERIESLSSAP